MSDTSINHGNVIKEEIIPEFKTYNKSFERKHVADGLGDSKHFFGVLMFEKKYWRAQSFSSLSVLVKKEEEQDYTQVNIVASTERQDNILISLFASSENAFALKALETLQKAEVL